MIVPRSTTLPASTFQTPALPGFGVSGDANYAWFESFGVSPAVQSNPSKVSVSDQSALGAPTGGGGSVTRGGSVARCEDALPFERVQMVESLERDLGRQCWGRPRVVERLHLVRQFERVQLMPLVGGRSGPGWGVRGIERLDSKRVFERVQMTRCRGAGERGAGASIREPALCTFERVLTRSSPRETCGECLIHASFELVQMTSTAGGPDANRPARTVFERVQMGLGFDNFLPAARPPERAPQVRTAEDTCLRSTQQRKEENRMPPLK